MSAGASLKKSFSEVERALRFNLRSEKAILARQNHVPQAQHSLGERNLTCVVRFGFWRVSDSEFLQALHGGERNYVGKPVVGGHAGVGQGYVRRYNDSNGDLVLRRIVHLLAGYGFALGRVIGADAGDAAQCEAGVVVASLGL